MGTLYDVVRMAREISRQLDGNIPVSIEKLRKIVIERVTPTLMTGQAFNIRINATIGVPQKNIYGIVLPHTNNPVILISDGLNKCWRRFTAAKELMHFWVVVQFARSTPLTPHQTMLS